jgi:nicotinamidase/pyrazinamidase
MLRRVERGAQRSSTRSGVAGERGQAGHRLQPGDAVLVVDPQNDFCPGGSLGVADGDAIFPIVNAWMAAAEEAGVPVLVTRDWHPPHTTHFVERGGVWPPHCVQGTPGAEFHPALRVPDNALTVSKGMGEQEDAYSGFQARDERGVLLDRLLEERGVHHVYLMGLATDYCVRASALDAVRSGLQVTVVRDGVRAVNLRPTDGERAMQEMRAAGVEIV